MTVAIKDRRADPVPIASARRLGRPGRRPAPPWWFVVPALLLFGFVVLVPSARGVYYAFTDWDGLSPDFAFVGLGNFVEMLADPDATQALWHTLVIAVAITVIQNGIGLLLALGVNSAIRSRNVLRVLLFAPAVITPIVTAYLWRNLLGPRRPYWKSPPQTRTACGSETSRRAPRSGCRPASTSLPPHSRRRHDEDPAGAVSRDDRCRAGRVQRGHERRHRPEHPHTRLRRPGLGRGRRQSL